VRAWRGRTAGPPSPSEATLTARIQSVISKREKLGLLYLDEVEDRASAIRASEIKVLAPMLGEAEGVNPLSADEKNALQHRELKSHRNEITTITNRLQTVPGLRIPDKPDDIVGGLCMVVGDYDATDLFLFSIPGTTYTHEDKLLVGVIGPAGEVTTGMGHDEMMYVTPLTAHATEVLGAGTHRFGSRFLAPVTLKEIQNIAPTK
jgi:hypothetical protein